MSVNASQPDPRRLRRARPLDQALPATWRWIADLPPDIRPLSLLEEFPRIANILARTWSDVPGFAAYMDSLLHDRRGGRRGFPGAVHNELLTLRDFFEGRYPSSPDARDRSADATEEMQH